MGQIQYRDGVQYYSPNSLQVAYLNLDTVSRSLESNPFKPGTTGNARVRYQDFTHPRRWSEAFAWIAFVPRMLPQWYDDRHSYFGHILSHFPPMKTFVDPNGKACGYTVPSDNEWVNLESNIYNTVVILSKHYHIPCVLPFLPNAIGYRGMWPTKRQLWTRLEQSREWFLVWFGALSYLVSSVRHPSQRGLKSQLDHQWCSVLRSKGVPPSFIDALLRSLIMDSRLEVPRAGIILEVGNPPNSQPHPFWFVDQGVPVWYRWGDFEESLSQGSDTFCKLRPAPSSMHSVPPGSSTNSNPSTTQFESYPLSQYPQPSLISPGPSATPDPTRSPPASLTSNVFSPTPLRGADTPPRLNLDTDSSPACDKPSDDPLRHDPEWVAFFESRENACRQFMKSETPRARQRRENRMRTPATSSAKVFEWYPSEVPGFRYQRIPVLAKARSDTLMQYSSSQKRYDPVFNEWDCCTEWGPDDESEDESEGPDMEEDPADPNPNLPPNPLASIVAMDNSPPSNAMSYVEADLPSESFVREGESGDYESLMDDVQEAFGLFYGHSYPVPGDEPPLNSSNSPDKKDKTFFLRAVGLDAASVPRDDYRYFESAHYHSAQDFLRSLGTRQSPTLTATWDLKDESIQPIRLSYRFQYLRIVQLNAQHKVDPHDRVERYYIFEDPKGLAPWKLGVTSATAAALVCRLPKHYTEFDIAFFLVQHGVAFRAFYPSRILLRPPLRDLLTHHIPERRHDHVFTQQDYDAYLHMRTLLLGQSHMQAALKRGGVVWRLAIGTLGASRANLPPSLWGASHRIELSGDHFYNDILTTTELDLICGAYECVSDDGKHRSLKSWWPLARYYEKNECGENYGRWTPRRESWYSRRLNGIEAGELNRHQPLTYTEWKSSQHGPATLRNFHLHIEHSSSQLIDAHSNKTARYDQESCRS